MKYGRLIAIVVMICINFCPRAFSQSLLIETVLTQTYEDVILYINCDTGEESILQYKGHLVDCEYQNNKVCIADENNQKIYVLDKDLCIVKILDASITDAVWVTALCDNTLFYIIKDDEYELRALNLESGVSDSVNIPEYVCENNYAHKEDTVSYGIKCISYDKRNGLLYSGDIDLGGTADLFISGPTGDDGAIFYCDNDYRSHYICAGICPMWISENSFIYFNKQTLYKCSNISEPNITKVLNIWDAFENDKMYSMEPVYCSNIPNDNCVSIVCKTYSWFGGLHYVVLTVNVNDGSFSKYVIKTDICNVHPGVIIGVQA